ncbi:flagellar hook assembly protein FlgD [Roseovarius aquimarinus]|uniref:Basal-body rod modification protein FlgD n=1 Tax=Roseovarius aquimarinus TaxID=1229156 RepID=A0ABW7I768_9RHOB
MNDIASLTGAGATYGAARAGVQRADNGTLGQKDFLTLMTAQLQNQDPFKPMENGEFLAQMAQFSTVSGIESVNATLGDISSQIGGGRLATASSLMNQQVLVPGTLARPDAEGGIHGAAELAEAASGVSVIYSDATSGAELHRQELGAQGAGLVPFDWTDVPPGTAAVRVSIQSDTETPPAPFVYARVVGVDMPEGGQDLTLRIEDYGLRSSLEITSIR